MKCVAVQVGVLDAHLLPSVLPLALTPGKHPKPKGPKVDNGKTGASLRRQDALGIGQWAPYRVLTQLPSLPLPGARLRPRQHCKGFAGRLSSSGTARSTEYIR